MQSAANINNSRFISLIFLSFYLPREPVEREPLDELDLSFDERVVPLLWLCFGWLCFTLPREPLALD